METFEDPFGAVICVADLARDVGLGEGGGGGGEVGEQGGEDPIDETKKRLR